MTMFKEIIIAIAFVGGVSCLIGGTQQMAYAEENGDKRILLIGASVGDAWNIAKLRSEQNWPVTHLNQWRNTNSIRAKWLKGLSTLETSLISSF